MRFKKYEFLFFIVVAIVLLVMLFYNKINDKRLQDGGSPSLNMAYDPVLLDGFRIYKQPNSWSCGPTTIKMVAAYIYENTKVNQNYNETLLANRKSGMLPKTFEKYLGECLIGYDVELRCNISDSILLKSIYGQLKKGLPVPVYFSTINQWDKPNYDTHYSVVIGLDFKKESVTIANAYGFKEEVGLNDFLESLKYENYKNEPLGFRLATMTGIIKKNNIYIIKKKS
jgi:hypothetical protein